MNGFEMHNIKHSSVSQLNLYEGNPAMWILQYLFLVRALPSPAMFRGIVIETAVAAVLTNQATIEPAIKKALKTFDDKFSIALDDRTEKERAVIESMIRNTVEVMQEYGEPIFSIDGEQQKVKINCVTDNFTLPIIGYLDFVYPEHGLVIDLKTTNRMPSTMSAAHRRQRCFYEKCMGNHEVKFLYVTSKKTKFLSEGDVAEELALMKSQLIRQEKFLKQGNKEFLRDIVPIDPNHFFWADKKKERKEIFGI